MSEQKVLATVGQRTVTEGDLQRVTRSVDPQTAMQFKSPEGRKRLIQELVNQELFYMDAVERKLDQSEEFKNQLEKAKSDLVKQFAINDLLGNIQVSEDEMQAYYDQNIREFRSPESVRASHILVESEEKASNILKEIDSGLAFEEAAQKYSSCPSHEQGGDLGYFTRGRMVPEFEQAAFEMKEGQVSKPVKTQFGYHLIKLVDRKKEQSRGFEEVKPQIEQQLLGHKQEEAYFNKVNELNKKYEVKMMV